MRKSNGKVNVSDIFRAKRFDVCGKDSREKSAVDKAIESLCDENCLFVEDIMRCDVKEEIASEILKSCASIENALIQGKQDELRQFSTSPILDKDQDDISLLNIDVSYVDICLDISNASKIDEIFKEKKLRLEKKIREVTGSDGSTIEELEKCMLKRDEIIVGQSRMHKNVLELCKKIRKLEVDINKMTGACVSPQTTDALVVKFDCKTEIQKTVKIQRKVDKVCNMAMLKGCQLLMCREGNKRITKDNAELKEDLKKMIVIIRDLHSEYKRIQSDLCDSDNTLTKRSGQTISRDELPTNEKHPSFKAKDPTKQSPKKDAMIVKPKVDKPSDIPTRRSQVEKEPCRIPDTNKTKQYEATIPGDIPYRGKLKEKQEKEKENDSKENKSRKREFRQKENLNDAEILEESDVYCPPKRVEIKQYDATIPGTIPYQTPEKERQKDNPGENPSNLLDSVPEKLPGEPFFLPATLDEKAKDENEMEVTQKDENMEIRDFDEDLQADSSDGFRWDSKKPDFKRRVKRKKNPKDGEKVHEKNEEIQNSEPSKRNDNKEKDEHKPSRKNPQEDEFSSHFEVIELKEYDASTSQPRGNEIPLKDGTSDYGYCDTVKIEQYDALINGYVSMKSSNRKQEVGTRVIDERNFNVTLERKNIENKSSEQETDEDEDTISLEEISSEDKHHSDKSPPGGAAGGAGSGASRHNTDQNRASRDTTRNNGSSTDKQYHRSSSNGRKRGDFETSRIFQANSSVVNLQVEDFVHIENSLGKRDERKRIYYPKEHGYFSGAQEGSKIKPEKLFLDSEASKLNLKLNTKGSAHGFLNEDHTMSALRMIQHAMNNQEAIPDYSKLYLKDFGKIKAMHDWQGVFGQYQQAYAALVKAKHDYEEKYEAKVKDLAKYKEDYEILRKVNSGAEDIVDQIKDLKKRNLELEERIYKTDVLRRKELENQHLLRDNETFKTKTNHSAQTISCYPTGNLSLIQKISHLKGKIGLLSNQNEMILFKYEDSKKKLIEHERNLKSITDKMLEPPKELIVPMIPGKGTSYKDWVNFSKYLTERLNEYQVAMVRSYFVLKMVQEERDKLRVENDQQKCALQSAIESLKRFEQNDPSLMSQVTLLTQETKRQASALKNREEETKRLIEENKNLNKKVEVIEETAQYYRKCLEKLNFMSEGLESSTTDNKKIGRCHKDTQDGVGSTLKSLKNVVTNTYITNRHRNNNVSGLTRSINNSLPLSDVRRVIWNLPNTSSINSLHPTVLSRMQIMRPCSNTHEFYYKLLHTFIEKNICKCIEKIHAKGCSQKILQDLEDIKSNLEWGKRKLNEMLGVGKKRTGDQNAFQLQKVCERIIQSGTESLTAKEIVFLYNVVYNASMGPNQKMKTCQKTFASRSYRRTGIKKWKDLEADINLITYMLGKLRFQGKK